MGLFEFCFEIHLESIVIIIMCGLGFIVGVRDLFYAALI